MAIGKSLHDRSGGTCELCGSLPATVEYTVSPKSDSVENQVALCDTCFQAIEKNETGDYWRFLEGAIWNPEPAVQALSYRLLYAAKASDWAADILGSVEPEEHIVQWALSAFEVAEVHRDSFGNALSNGDNVVLTQALDVKGTSFSAPKGTVVKRIRLVPDNIEHIEGKINDQTIVILTKYVKKG
ncbi:alkylphosphonate utilization protein [Chitinophaga sp. Cy-1792]|uniref:PhnA domain-containing protein n=1 Tax=Chitinophaga sp. Cy-1792 TaxID=2608339 RepID=UPI00141E1382|nr:alkylphosphonate utilization protein [Chitinophaga sp. Cy-1792]NIG55083.1 PhnA protein [Chitinophaga sp. Cy-1792]